MPTFRAVIDAQADAQPRAPFLFAPEPAINLDYAALRVACQSVEAFLAAQDTPPGSTVSFMLGNGVSATTLLLGGMYAGYVVSPVNLLAQDVQLAHIIHHSETRFVFAAPEEAPRVRRLAATRPGAAIIVRATDPDRLELPLPTTAPSVPAAKCASNDPALLMYTSGTTGLPKGVMLSHANMLAAGRAVAAAHALTAADRVLSSLPLYHINGQCIGTVAPLVSGGSIVMPHRFSTSQWWSLVETYQPTWLNFVPTIIAYLLHGADLTPGQAASCRRIRFGRCASAPLSPEQHKAFEQRFGISVIEAMGLTETASVAFANPLPAAQRKYGSPGLPVLVEARVVTSAHTTCADGEPGEIELRGSNVMRGYFKDPELTAATIDGEGWLATGDLGFRDADGFYFVTGRRKELIIKGGENIAPREIDEALLTHPAVLEAAAVGVPDAAYGQEILACIVVKPGHACTEEDLRAHCLRDLGRYKTPRYFQFVEALPKGPSGKVQRLQLGAAFRSLTAQSAA